MDRRTLTFITVSVLIIILYQELVLKRLPQSPPAEVPVPTASLDSAAPPVPTSADTTSSRPVVSVRKSATQRPWRSTMIRSATANRWSRLLLAKITEVPSCCHARISSSRRCWCA